MRAAFQTLRGDQRRVFVGAVLAALRRRDQPDVRPSSEEVLRAGVDLGDDAAGVARVEGLTVVSSDPSTSNASSSSSSSPLVLKLVVRPLCPAAADAVDAAGAAAPLSLPMSVQPSRAPARLQLLLDGRPLPMIEEEGPRAAAAAAANNNNDDDDAAASNDDAPTARLAGVPAGSSVAGLSLRVLDAAGRPCDPSLPGSGLDGSCGGDAATGKLQVSWMRGHKKVKASDLAGGAGSPSEGTGDDGAQEAAAAGGLPPLAPPRGLITLPPLEAPERVGEAVYVRGAK